MAEWEGFEKLGRLGVGATGTVWLARQLSVDRAVALKELAPEIAGDVVVCERLRREAQLLARLDDPNCVAVYSFLESGTAAALVMEYVDGVSLSTLSAAGRLNIEQALAVLEGALSGLAHAHGRGIVHGDLKPENILLASNGQSKLVDFGLAAAVGTVRAPGIGSPTYLSPEAAAGGPLGVTSDLYSMALVLSELVAGTLLPGTDPATAAAAVPSPIAGLVRHALDPDPAARPRARATSWPHCAARRRRAMAATGDAGPSSPPSAWPQPPARPVHSGQPRPGRRRRGRPTPLPPYAPDPGRPASSTPIPWPPWSPPPRSWLQASVSAWPQMGEAQAPPRVTSVGCRRQCGCRWRDSIGGAS